MQPFELHIDLSLFLVGIKSVQELYSESSKNTHKHKFTRKKIATKACCQAD